MTDPLTPELVRAMLRIYAKAETRFEATAEDEEVLEAMVGAVPHLSRALLRAWDERDEARAQVAYLTAAVLEYERREVEPDPELSAALTSIPAEDPGDLGDLHHARIAADEAVARLEAELSAAENQGAPEGWTQGDGAWCWDGDGTGLDSTQIRVYHARGYDPRAPARPYARIVRSRSVGVDVIDLDADTVLAAIEAAEAWLDEHPIEGVVP